jgi:glycosyltransferase involved in cell wall biosynthesis
MTSLILNMIVKNESKIIKRLLESVYNVIDYYCICDTGSTDNTVEIITSFFKEKNITGKIIYNNFKNFEYNRNYALYSCVGLGDYVLLLDADMVLKTNNFDKNVLSNFDACYIYQQNNSLIYKNLRIVKNNGLFSYKGVTHEYINVPDKTLIAQLDKDKIIINDIGDGGAKNDKFDRDIKLLLNGINSEPTNERYYFYLANSYNDSGKYMEAIEMYKKRINLGGWNQEVWYSYYRIGLAYKHMREHEKAIYYWLLCYECCNNRLEALYQIIYYYRVEGKHKLSKLFYDIAISILNKNLNYNDYLFTEYGVYTYKLYIEYTIIAYYLDIKNISDEIITILNICRDENEIQMLFSNMKFYKNVLNKKETIHLNSFFNDNILNFEQLFTSSSSCMIPQNNGYLVNVRYVNYNIDKKDGHYNFNGAVITHNKRIELDNQFNIINEQLLQQNFDLNSHIIGIEDVRIFSTNDEILFLGTLYNRENNKTIIVNGTYDNLENVNFSTPTFSNNSCEKNWVYYTNTDSTANIIYHWHPLTICKLNNNYLDIIEKKETPRYFSRFRGSTNGFNYNDEIWFITHMVSYETVRHYYHVFVVFDKKMNLLRYSAPFSFEGEPIEYCLSIIVEDNRVLINYSTWDSTTQIGIYEKDYIDSLLKY